MTRAEAEVFVITTQSGEIKEVQKKYSDKTLREALEIEFGKVGKFIELDEDVWCY